MVEERSWVKVFYFSVEELFLLGFLPALELVTVIRTKGGQ